MKIKKRKKFKMSKFIVPFVIISIFTFTGVAIWAQVVTGIELSATLITCFYAFCTGELWMLASIKKTKIIKDIDGDGIPDEINLEINDNYEENSLQRIKEILEFEENESKNG